MKKYAHGRDIIYYTENTFKIYFMKEFRQKHIIKQRIYSKPVIFLLIVILIFIANGTWNVFKKSHQSNQKLIIAEENLVELEKKRDTITEEIKRLETNVGVEEEIRSKFDLAREGEKTIVIVDEEVVEVQAEERGRFETLWSHFKDSLPF